MSAGHSPAPPTGKADRRAPTVAVLGGPDDLRTLLAPVPDDVTFRGDLRAHLDVVVFSTVRRTDLVRRIGAVVHTYTLAVVSCQKGLRRSRFRILPLPVFGSSLAQVIERGIL